MTIHATVRLYSDDYPIEITQYGAPVLVLQLEDARLLLSTLGAAISTVQALHDTQHGTTSYAQKPHELGVT